MPRDPFKPLTCTLWRLWLQALKRNMLRRGGWSLGPPNRDALLAGVSKAASLMGRVKARQTRVEARFNRH